MTNEQLLDDLKQFITAQGSQLEERLSERIDNLSGRVDNMDSRMATKDDLNGVERRIMEFVGDAIQQGNEDEAVKGQLDDHERRLHRLEHRTA